MEYKKIAVRGGHNQMSTGASSQIMNELVEDRKVKDAVIKYLRMGGVEVLDVTPGPCSEGQDLKYGTDKANSWGADLFVSCHFNNCYNDIKNVAIGSEVEVYSDFEAAQRVQNGFVKLGFRDRGVKVVGKSLHELRETKMPAMILEPCFVESSVDVELYRKIGADKLGQIIAEAILNKSLQSTPVNDNTNNNVNNNVNNNTMKEYGENGTAVVKVNLLNVRDNASTNSNIVASYSFGESFIYDKVIITNEYVWVSYISYSGARRYVAVKNKVNGERFADCY